MSQNIANFFNTLLIFLETCMLLIMLDGFFSKKRKALQFTFSFILIGFLSCLLLYFAGNSLTVKLLLIPSIFAVWTYFFYDATPIKCAFTVLFWVAFLVIGDNYFLILLGTVLDKEPMQLMSDPSTYYFICFSIKIAEMLGIVVLHAWMKTHFSQTLTDFLDWVRVIAFPAASLIISMFLMRIYNYAPEMSWELTICNAIVLITDIVSVFLLNSLEQRQEVKRDNVILRQNMKAELDNVEAWRTAYDGQRKQTHDFQNQLLVIHGLVKQKAPQSKILEYIEQLQSIGSTSTIMVATHRPVVDIILNQKYSIAKSRNIRFVSQLDDLSQFPLPDDALVIVLSNLIDNAIEACEKIADVTRRYISLNMKLDAGVGFVHIENSCSEPVRIYKNKVITTKKNQKEHGYGLQNIFSVLETHGAIYLLDYSEENRSFSFSAQILGK